MSGSGSRVGSARLAFVVFIVIHAVVWSQSRYGHVSQYAVSYSSRESSTFTANLVKRAVLSNDEAVKQPSSTLPLLGIQDHHFSDEECAPITVPSSSQCQHVETSCEIPQTFLSLPYLQQYFCSAPSARPLIFAGLLVWLVFLFSTLGISASDFFCPNLAAISELLGLDENVAGVTFLAFGNGSPDVFSTFSAMRANAGSLAIGELLGAASFIVSVVVGSICIIKPFTVDRRPFLRDVGFFTVAVAMLLVILWDQHIHAWEAGALVALYVVYVIVVVVGSWWERRQFRRKQREALVRSEYADDEVPQIQTWTEPYRDEPSSDLLIPPTPSSRARAHSSPAIPSLGIDTQVQAPSMSHLRSRTQGSISRSPSPSPSPRLGQMPSFSLVGALEFRSVVASLQAQSAGAALSVFESPLTPYVGGHYHNHPSASGRIERRHSTQSGRSTRTSEPDPWDAALAHGVPLHARSPRSEHLIPPGEDDREGGAESEAPSTLGPDRDDGLGVPQRDRVPLIATTPASPASEASISFSVDPYEAQPMSKRKRVMYVLRHTLHVLFPTLHNFGGKSILGMIASVLAAPAVLALTLTLPVHVLPHRHAGAEEKGGAYANGNGNGNSAQEGRLVDFEEEGVERLLTAAEVSSEIEREDLEDQFFNKWLMAAQLLLGPEFCVAVLFAHHKNEIWLLIATAVASLAAAVLVLVFADKGNDRMAQMGRCFMGFAVAVVWIMAIADEVVNVLKTFGYIFGLSDAIIGLTIFAVGNSLADFVANISVAAFAPVMAFSACFGGPMLNMLLGIGGSGSYIINSTGGEPYSLHFSTTLLVSTIGLLSLLVATMIFVPLNGFHLPKKWGVFLILSYIVIMTTNVIVEIKR